MFTSLGLFLWLTIFFTFIFGIPGLEGLRVPLYLVILLIFGLGYAYKVKLTYINFLLILFAAFPLLQFIVLQGELLSTIQAVIVIFSLFLIHNFARRQELQLNTLNTIAIFITVIMFTFHYNIIGWNARSAGLFGNPNTTAYVAITLLPIVLMFSQSRKIQSICWLNVIAIVIFTASRGALMALILGLIAYFITKLFKLRYLGLCAVSIGCLIFSFYAIDIANYIKSYGFSSQSFGEDTRLLRVDSNSREDIYLIAYERFFSSETEYIGLGFDQAKFDIGAGIAEHAGTHNSFLEILLRLGFIGLTFFSIYLFVLLRKIASIQNIRNRGLTAMHFVVILSLSTNASVFLVLNFYFFYLITIIEVGNSLDSKYSKSV